MERIPSNYNFSRMEKLLLTLDVDHSASTLSALKTEFNRFFMNAKCKEIIYTQNTDKMFFGMRVYPNIATDEVINIITDAKPRIFSSYIIEIDSKLYDQMLALDQRELTAIALHEVGHIVYDSGQLDLIKKNIDMYFAKSGGSISYNEPVCYKNLLAYAIKDSLFKQASIFAKLGNEEMIADTFVMGCGYGPDLQSAFAKLLASTTYLNRGVDNRFIVLAWVVRMQTEIRTKRLPMLKTLNNMKQVTASELEKREIEYASRNLAQYNGNLQEAAGVLTKTKEIFTKKYAKFKANSIRVVKDSVYELRLRLRTATDPEDLIAIIREANDHIAIIQDYLLEDIPAHDRKELESSLQELFSIRTEAARDKSVVNKYDSLITVVYPEIK